MAKYTGYVTIPITSYDAWKNATNGNGYDADGSYGCQCWDFAAEFWWNVGFPQGYPLAGGTEYAYMVWDDRNSNISYGSITYFDLVYNASEIKKGDIIVFSPTGLNPAGHIGFADVNYGDWTPDPNQPYEFPVLSENNNGTPDPAGGSYVNLHGYDIRLFRGAFRYIPWEETPPTPTRTKTHFPWVLYANRLRLKRQL